MKLIIGLGNPGNNYNGTRHNTGFMALDMFAAAHNLRWQQKDRFNALVAEGMVGGQKVLLAKPTLFYNLSGQAAQGIKQFYKIGNDDILIVHDELSLPLGTIRTRVGGSDAGNNGIKSISAAVGGDTVRLRIGIANEYSAKTDASDFVLSRFSAGEQPILKGCIKACLDMMAAFVDGSLRHRTIRVK